MKVKKLFIETFGCQMNIADSEVVASIMKGVQYELTNDPDNADLHIINTCAVRDNAEQKIWNKLEHYKGLKKKNKTLKLGIIGCMAQHIGDEFSDAGVVDFVAGPDSYRNIPNLLADSEAKEEHFEADLDLSLTETYENILPIRLEDQKVAGFVSITRGCNNFCTYCIVPYTRGRERSRSYIDIINEVNDLFEKGYKEVALLGQNVNSYDYSDDEVHLDFPDLLEKVALAQPGMRIRFTTSHPKDISDKLIETIAKYNNIANHIHLPVQSGSNAILDRMNRKYTREWYLERIGKIRELIPNCGISTDIFSGFCGETPEDHQESLSIMREVAYDSAFMFKYSEREGTYAANNLKDDVSEEIKTERLNELIALQNDLSLESNKKDVNKQFTILIEGTSKRRDDQVFGRTEQNKVVIIDNDNYQIGDFVDVVITDCTSATLFGKKA